MPEHAPGLHRRHVTGEDVQIRAADRVAPYGVTNWVRNARAAGQVTLRRAGRRETLRVTEVPAADRVPILRQYWREVPVTRKFFGTTSTSSDELWAAEAQRHPVFHLADTDSAVPDGRS
ncbi:hypothetical protein [Dactylosporangium sp. NPDC049140]|uniref:hypothetical protein n=1 Tax=Dactylosporangium sp. NPDC049140 TaxID=3155647 RepID=UPI0033DA515C